MLTLTTRHAPFRCISALPICKLQEQVHTHTYGEPSIVCMYLYIKFMWLWPWVSICIVSGVMYSLAPLEATPYIFETISESR